MTDPFTSFVQKRAAEKAAAGLGSTIARQAGGVSDVLGQLLEMAITKKNPAFTAGGNAPERLFSAGRAAGVGLAGLGAASVLDVTTGDSSLGSAAEYALAKRFVPLDDRIQATDTAAAAFMSQGGKNMANILDDAIRGGVNRGAGAALAHNRSFNQDLQFQAAMNHDQLLSSATPQDAEMLRRSFNSMTRFAPDLATDEFAVKNFLRESMMAANGPDYATLGNMARVNEDIASSSILPQKAGVPV
jgi:hypothetical protein